MGCIFFLFCLIYFLISLEILRRILFPKMCSLFLESEKKGEAFMRSTSHELLSLAAAFDKKKKD